MAPKRPVRASFVEKEEERDLNLLGRAQLCSVIGTGLLALTYVSGYLIATTYLATYGISADASEFLRAKYLYIGCQYWLFLALFGVLARVFGLGFHLLDTNGGNSPEAQTRRLAEAIINNNHPKAIKEDYGPEIDRIARRLEQLRNALGRITQHLEAIEKADKEKSKDPVNAKRAKRWKSIQQRINASSTKVESMLTIKITTHLETIKGSKELKAIKAESDWRSQEHTYNAWQRFRWVLVVALILGIFVLEIMLVKPGDISTLLPVHAVLLLSIALYQTTFYMGYSRESYRWGLLDGYIYVDWMRWIYGAGVGIAIVGIILWKAACKTFFPGHPQISAWPTCVLAVLIVFSLLLAAIFVTLNSENLRSLDNKYPLREEDRHGLRFFWKPIWGLLYAFTVPFRFRSRSPWTARLKSVILFFAVLFYSVIAFAMFIQNGLSSQKWGLPLHRLAWLSQGLSKHHRLWLSGIWLMYYGTLFLSLIVLSNILVLSYMYHKMRKNLGISELTPWHSWVLMAVAVAVLYVVSVFSFSYLIYPFVPFQKAGGKYLAASAVTVNLNHAPAGCSSQELETEFDTAARFIVIEEDANWVYFAPINKEPDSDPGRWARWAFCKQKYGDDATCRPRVYSVNKRCIANTESNVVP